MKVLLIEDDIEISEMLRDFLVTEMPYILQTSHLTKSIGGKKSCPTLTSM